MASVEFGGGLGDPAYANDPEREIELDPERAAAELRRAAYDVYLMPEKYGPRLAHPLDDFIEAVILLPPTSSSTSPPVKHRRKSRSQSRSPTAAQD